MKIVDRITAHIPKSIYFTLDEVETMLKLLRMKRQYSTQKELTEIEPLIKGFESLLPDLREEERHKAGY